jgi:hypothetical protein
MCALCSHIVRFSCSGCELPVLQELFYLPWDTHNVLEQVRLLFIDLTFSGLARSSSSGGSGGAASSSGVCTAASRAVNVTGWDDVFNLLHQQLGFKGFWRQELNSGAVRLAWMRGPMPAHAKLQAPESSLAAEALRAAAARTPRAELTRGICNCCASCCGAGAGSSGCTVLRRMACALGVAGRNEQCVMVTAANGGSSNSSGRGESGLAEWGGCGSGCCQSCCCFKPALWAWFQGQSHASKSSTSGSSTNAPHTNSWYTLGVLPVLVSWALVVASVAVFQQAYTVNRVHRAAKRKQYCKTD